MLHHEIVGRGPRLVLAHGFTQNRQCWGDFVEALSDRFELVLVDLPGHGLSNHDDADLWEAADLLVAVDGAATYIGYSMGGRIGLHAALRHPESVERLAVIGATAGIDEAAERAARREADDELATRLLDIGVPAFLDRWLASPLFAGLSDAAACRPQREANRAAGLAASLRSCGTGTQEPLWAELAGLRQPLLAIAGSDDHKFTELGQRLVAAAGTATGSPALFHRVPGSHAVHLEAPRAVAGAISDWLDQL